MQPFRVLHVDDDPDIGDVVGLSLGLDPDLTLKSCAKGDEVFAIARDWAPDIILCDVRMPSVDGPAVLARLRANTSTSHIPLIFMTASARSRELEELKILGAVAVIVKPFNPATLAATVRSHLHTAEFAAISESFSNRLHRDATQLAILRNDLRDEPESSSGVRKDLLSCAHKLAGAAGIFGFHAVSCRASALEESILEELAGHGNAGKVQVDLDALLACIGRQ